MELGVGIKDHDNFHQQRSLPRGVCCAEPSMSRNALLSWFHIVGAAAPEFSSLIFPILIAFLMKVHTRQIHWRNVEFTATLLDQHIDPFTVLRSGIRMLQVGSTSFSMSLAADIPSGTRITLLAIRVQEKGVSLMCMMLQQ